MNPPSFPKGVSAPAEGTVGRSVAGIETSIIADFPGFDELVQASRDTFVLLPAGIEAPSDKRPIFASSLPTVLKLARAEGVPMKVYKAPESPPLLDRRSSEWFGPAIFISSLFMTENPTAVSLALGMLSNYLTTLFSGREGVSVSLDIYVADDGTRTTTKVSYRGPVSGIRDLRGPLDAAVGSKRR
jgi:hypothetical protein